jgi:hypothetical protein
MKLAKDMTPAERQAAIDAAKIIARTLKPMDTTKKAAQMTATERAEWLAEHKRKFS